jgi:hypothetical protein
MVGDPARCHHALDGGVCLRQFLCQEFARRHFSTDSGRHRHTASPQQLGGLRASDNGVYPIVEELDLHIDVERLVTRIMEASPLAIRR